MQTDCKFLQMTRGLHIYVLAMNGLYQHHGISCGDGTVIHHPGGLPNKSNSAISRTSIANFANGRDVFIFPHFTGDPPEIVVKRAESKLGEAGYNLFNNNCEHFAVWCKTGIKEFHQIKNYIKGSSLLLSGVLLPEAALLAFGTALFIQGLQDIQPSSCTYNPDERIFIVGGSNTAPSILGLYLALLGI